MRKYCLKVDHILDGLVCLGKGLECHVSLSLAEEGDRDTLGLADIGETDLHKKSNALFEYHSTGIQRICANRRPFSR